MFGYIGFTFSLQILDLKPRVTAGIYNKHP